jgi:hypothetical protein
VEHSSQQKGKLCESKRDVLPKLTTCILTLGVGTFNEFQMLKMIFDELNLIQIEEFWLERSQKKDLVKEISIKPSTRPTIERFFFYNLYNDLIWMKSE